MSNRLRGKRALITAAGQGMGRAAAAAFVREGEGGGASHAGTGGGDERALAGEAICHREAPC